MQTLIRRCPKCNSERPLAESFCEGEIDGVSCGWSLSSEPVALPASASSSEEQASPTAEESPPIEANVPPQRTVCANGHELPEGDIYCLTCGQTACSTEPIIHDDQIIDGWRLIKQLSSHTSQIELFQAEKIENHDGKRYVINLFAPTIEPDEALYPVVKRLDPSKISPLISFGQYNGRHYQVWQEISDRSLDDIFKAGGYEKIDFRQFIEALGTVIREIEELGIRHRDLRPSNVLVDPDHPTQFQITGFASAVYSQLDLAEILCPLNTSRYTAPESIGGGISSASDWWALGAIGLELATHGHIFDGVNEKAFLIHVVTRGIEIPSAVDSNQATLLRGLLDRDTSSRWHWDQVQKWLRNEIAPSKATIDEQHIKTTGPALTLLGKEYFRPETFALAAAESSNWDEAQTLLSKGAVATWLNELGFDAKLVATVKSITLDNTLTDDYKLAFSLLALNENLPLSLRGEIVNPAWLLANPVAGYELITGSRVERLRQLAREPLLQMLSDRAENIRNRIESLEIDVDEPRLREALLATSRRNLENAWARLRVLFPDSSHPGISGLMQRRSPSEEEYIILLSTPVEQFTAASVILEKAESIASKTPWKAFKREQAETLLTVPRALLYQLLDEALEGFARCGIDELDDWADSYRMEKRISFERLLVLLSVPDNKWVKPAKQQYVSNILGFFEKKILAKVNRGPLVRQTISRTSAAIDLMEVSTTRKSTQHIIDHLLERSGNTIEIDPSALEDNPQVAARLSSLIKKTRMFTRDTGRHGLFLGFPYLMYQTVNQDGSKSFRAAPLMLWPVKVEANSSGRGRVKLASENQREEVRLNPALEGLLGSNSAETEKWKRCADEVLQRSSIRHKDVLETFAQIATVPERSLAKLPGKDVMASQPQKYVSGSAVLFNCDFAGKSIADDLRFLKERPLEGTALEKVLKVSTGTPNPRSDRTNATPFDNNAIMDLDPSQSEAVFKADGTLGLHVEGPPGTGKSQTIVNIVADSVARGQTVLVICQKQAALNIVEKRLKAQGLENRLFLIKDTQKDREPLLKAFRAQFETRIIRQSNLIYLRNEHAKTVKKIQTLDEQINSQHDAIFAQDDRIGLSYRQVLSQLIATGSSNDFVPVPELRRHFAQTGSGIASDADISQIEDDCSGIGQLWLDANFEDSPLHILRLFSWDSTTEDSLFPAIAKYLELERARQKSLVQFPSSPDLYDVEPVKLWLENNNASLSLLNDKEWYRIASWLSLFPATNALGEEFVGRNLITKLQDLNVSIARLNKEWYHEAISRVLISQSASELNHWIEVAVAAADGPDSPVNSQRNNARWQVLRFLHAHKIDSKDLHESKSPVQSTFDFFIEKENERMKVLEKYEECFDTEDGEKLTTWLAEHSSYFSTLDPVTRKNLARWHHLFDDPDALPTPGSEISAALTRARDSMETLDQSWHNDKLFEIIRNLSEESLSSFHDQANAAMAPASPFKAEKHVRLAARWSIVRLLAKSKKLDLNGVPDGQTEGLSSAFAQFIKAEEQRLDSIRDHKDVLIIEDASALEEWLATNRDLFAGMSDKDRQHLAEWIDLFRPEQNQKPAGARLIADLEELQKQIIALEKDHHSDRFFTSIADCHPTCLVDWISMARKVNTGHAANPTTFLPRWRMRRLLRTIGSEYNASTVLEFLRASELEHALGPLRSRAMGIQKQLHISHRNVLTFNVSQLADSVSELLTELHRAQKASVAVFTCPTSAQALHFVASKTKEAFQDFADKAGEAIRFCQARVASRSALNDLTEWFDEAWINKSAHTITGTQDNLTELQEIWDGLRFFNDTTMEIFAKAIKLEFSLAPIRATIVQAAYSLKEHIEANDCATLLDLRKTVKSILVQLSKVSEVSDKVNSCPCERSDKTFVDDPAPESFTSFIHDAQNAISRFHTRKASLEALMALSTWFEESWLQAARQDIVTNLVVIDRLNELSGPLKLYEDTTFNRFLAAAKLEASLTGLREEFKTLADTLNKKFDPGFQTVLVLEELATALETELLSTSRVIEQINSCPETVAARRFAARGTVKAFSELQSYLNGMICRQECRENSLEALKDLEEWFESDWLATQRSFIASHIVQLSELERIINALPSLHAFQQFRLKMRTIDKTCLEILAVCHKHRPKFLALARENIRTVIKTTIRREACLSWRTAIEEACPALLLESDELDYKIRALIDATENLTNLNKQLLVRPDWSSGISLNEDEWNAITRLRGQRMIRLREFVDKGSDLGLLAIRPIWLMNPEVASRLLPLQKAFFDKVIFDEASQLPVEFALPALYRAKQAIVSGDEKQMPPSDHFSSRYDSGEDDEYDEENDDYLSESQKAELEEKWNRREIKDCPDLLTLASSVLPSSRLEIHYRSEYRELIAFSNAAFYNGSLSVPSKYPPAEIRRLKPIEIVKANTIYKKQTNVGEAQKVIEVLQGLWRQSKRPSIGIVTFNLLQSELIEDLLAEEAEKDKRFGQIRQEEDLREEDGEDMSFFVKNLENVQGDERDIIIFSTTFGKNEKGDFLKNFGLVGNSGGDRRLNVAITRAKKKVFLVTSMPIEQISDSVQKNRLPRNGREYLHYYLEYASRISNGDLEQADQLLERLCGRSEVRVHQTESKDGFVADVQSFINHSGYETQSAGDDRGAFGLDLAVIDPKTGLFGLGIECDAPRHHLLKRAYHREVWRQSVLKKAVNKVHRISSRQWYLYPDRQQKLLTKVIQETMT
jgi:serine/threonine protein kinase